MGELVRWKLVVKPDAITMQTSDDGDLTCWHTATQIIAELREQLAIAQGQSTLATAYAILDGQPDLDAPPITSIYEP